MTSTNPSAILEIILALFELALYLVPIGVAALIAWNVYPKRFEVTRVVDGDSLEVRRGNRQLRVRIKHFDAQNIIKMAVAKLVFISHNCSKDVLSAWASTKMMPMTALSAAAISAGRPSTG